MTGVQTCALPILEMPIITTMHTVLEDPSIPQKRVMDEIIELSDYVIVMTQKAIEILKAANNIQESKIRLVPHGIPNISLDRKSVV